MKIFGRKITESSLFKNIFQKVRKVLFLFPGMNVNVSCSVVRGSSGTEVQQRGQVAGYQQFIAGQDLSGTVESATQHVDEL